uniref:Uncharacterized protein n=1 Tax=Timema poppense TaxID=170557 RepID=A0A7R9HAL0_TIMPO|nr:unnamed protein product [Timema poppensis]
MTSQRFELWALETAVSRYLKKWGKGRVAHYQGLHTGPSSSISVSKGSGLFLTVKSMGWSLHSSSSSSSYWGMLEVGSSLGGQGVVAGVAHKVALGAGWLPPPLTGRSGWAVGTPPDRPEAARGSPADTTISPHSRGLLEEHDDGVAATATVVIPSISGSGLGLGDSFPARLLLALARLTIPPLTPLLLFSSPPVVLLSGLASLSASALTAAKGDDETGSLESGDPAAVVEGEEDDGERPKSRSSSATQESRCRSSRCLMRGSKRRHPHIGKPLTSRVHSWNPARYLLRTAEPSVLCL